MNSYILDDVQAQSWLDVVLYGPDHQLQPDREPSDSSLHSTNYVATCAIVVQSTLLAWLLCSSAFRALEAWPRAGVAVGVTVCGCALLACNLCKGIDLPVLLGSAYGYVYLGSLLALAAFLTLTLAIVRYGAFCAAACSIAHGAMLVR